MNQGDDLFFFGKSSEISKQKKGGEDFVFLFSVSRQIVCGKNIDSESAA